VGATTAAATAVAVHRPALGGFVAFIDHALSKVSPVVHQAYDTSVSPTWDDL
jgi:hypothetical protein